MRVKSQPMDQKKQTHIHLLHQTPEQDILKIMLLHFERVLSPHPVNNGRDQLEKLSLTFFWYTNRSY